MRACVIKVLGSLSMSRLSRRSNDSHEDNQLRRKIAAEDLQTAQHDGAGLHGDRYRVGAPLASRSGVLRTYTLLISENPLGFADKILAIRLHVSAIFNSSTRRKERRSKLRWRPWDPSFELIAHDLSGGVRH